MKISSRFKFLRYTFPIGILLLLLVLTSCSKDKEPEPEPANSNDVKRTILVYAVNKSSLSYDFKEDRKEMLQALPETDMEKTRLLLYCTDTDAVCSLYEATRNGSDDSYDFSKLKSYSRSVTSTHPDRIAEVIDYALTLFPNAAYDLVFWGHGMSWFPYFSDHVVDSSTSQKSYGGEYTGGTNANGRPETDWTEITDLASAVPDGKFETIWFDCCYMSGIETLYEFRNKCKTFVGYPTEVWQYGLPYDLVLPYMMRENPDVEGAAKRFFDYYNESSSPVTVAVMDMKRIEQVADNAKQILNSGDVRPQMNLLVNYSRATEAAFYDFRQYVCETAYLNGAGADIVSAFNSAMDNFVTYHAESSFNFNRRPWNTSNISGISTHYFIDNSTPANDFYKTLAWYARIFETE